MKILIAGGGTGGHIIPALAITSEFQAQGIEILYVGNKDSMEERLTKDHHISFARIDVQKLYRKMTISHIMFPIKLITSIIHCVKIIRDYRPDAFVGTGGFVSGPVGIAAVLTGTPIYWQEQNSFPGITTRVISLFARKIYIAYQGAMKRLPARKCIMTGNPIHSKIQNEQTFLDFEQYNLSPDTPKILILGGSQGSSAINRSILESLDKLLDYGYEIIWQTGKREYDSLKVRIGLKKGVYLFAFSNEMGKIYNSATIGIARAGALTLAELETKKIPALLIPLPTAAANHQYFNACEQAEKKVAIVIEQRHLTSAKLMEAVRLLKENDSEMRNSFPDPGEESAAHHIVRLILESVHENKV